jgi:hypothetical protein
MTSIMTVSPDTPTTNPKRKPIKYCPICQDNVSGLLSVYLHVARKHEDWSETALRALLGLDE